MPNTTWPLCPVKPGVPADDAARQVQIAGTVPARTTPAAAAVETEVEAGPSEDRIVDRGFRIRLRIARGHVSRCGRGRQGARGAHHESRKNHGLHLVPSGVRTKECSVPAGTFKWAIWPRLEVIVHAHAEQVCRESVAGTGE